ncbi:MAG: tetratricopeptide repeat protein, partial [Pseudomonadota bacterium]
EQVADRLHWIRGAPNRRRKNLAFGGVAASLLIGITMASLGWYDASQSSQREQLAAALAQQSAAEARASLQIFQDVIGASFQGTHGRDARVIDVLEQAQRQIAIDETQPPYVQAMVKYTVGASYLNLDRIDEGLELLDQSVDLLADDDVAVALVRVSQAFHVCRQDAERANTHAVEIREIADGQLPADHHVFASALKIEACAAQRQGNDALAEQKLREALLLRPFSRFPDRGALGTGMRLAAVLIDQRRIAEALPLLEETYSGALELLGSQHDFTLGLANSMSQALLESSRFAEAAELLEQTLPAIEARSGIESTQWIATANTLAIALGRIGNPDRALALSKRVLDVSENLLGPSHQFTLAVRGSLGNRFTELGQLDKADVAMAEAAVATEQAVGPGHPMTLSNHINRVEVLTLMGRNAEAVELGHRTLAIAVESLGLDHGVTASAQAYLARPLAATGEVAEAESLFTRALVLYDRDNPHSIQTFEIRLHFATMLADQSRSDDARRELAALEPAFDLLPSEHPLLQKIEALQEQFLR